MTDDSQALKLEPQQQQSLRVAIIGAGSTGLTAIKQCLADGLEPTCFEQNPHIGGLWRYVEVDEKNNDPHSSVYKSTIINNSKELMTFSDFPIPTDWPSYLPHALIAKYFDMYAEHFNLLSHIRFNTTVEGLETLLDKRWRITTRTKEGHLEHDDFDYVMVCVGHHRTPRMPQYDGMKEFPGAQMHSHFYRSPRVFDGKRVVVVGCGNSGMDIAVELSYNAKQVYLSTRRGTLPWILPRLGFWGRPTDHFATRFYRYFLPERLRTWLQELFCKFVVGVPPPELRPKHRFSAAHPTIKSDFMERFHTGTIKVMPNIGRLNKDRSIDFVNDVHLSDVDAVVYATGFSSEIQFLDKAIINGGEGVQSRFEGEYRDNLTWLYKFMFPPRCPNIAFLGLIQQIGALMPLSELQARYITSMLTGQAVRPLPSAEEMDRAIQAYHDRNRKQFYGAARHAMEMEMMPYCDELAREIRCYPSSLRILFRYGLGMWRRVLFGVPTPIQYRLLGPQSWVGAKEWVIKYNSQY